MTFNGLLDSSSELDENMEDCIIRKRISSESSFKVVSPAGRMCETQSSQNEKNDSHSMNISDPNHGKFVLESLQMMTDSKEFCDVVVHVQNRKFYLHRNVLSCFSTYFESIFQRRLAARETFNVTSQSAEIFEVFVHYMYTGTIVIDKENVAEMLKLAHRLEVDKIKAYCADYLEKNISVDNCLNVKDLADKYKIQLLSTLALDFIRNHLNEVLAGAEVLGLDVLKLEKFLSNKAFGLSQLQIMKAIVSWTKKDVSNRENQLKPVLKLIKWMDIDIQLINDILENDPLFLTSDMALYLMLTHLKEKGLTFIQFHSVMEELTEKFSHLQSEKKEERFQVITKVKKSPEKEKKKKRVLRPNPIARLAALRSSLLLKTRRSSWLSGRSRRSESLLKCHLCDHHANDTTALEQHLSSVHSKDVTYKCGVCGFVCQWNNLYIKHIREHFPGPPYKCDTCEFTNEKLTAVLAHRSKHVQEKIYRCQQCSFNSKSQNSVLAHSKTHLPPPPKAGEKEEEASYERVYACDVCKFTTKTLSHLAAHKRIHSSGVYRCSHLNCKFTTGKKALLMAHTKSHEEPARPHSCNVCGRGFIEKSHLIRHERIHLDEKPFKCQECDYGSSRRDKLKEHLARHRKDKGKNKTKLITKPNNQSLQEKTKDSTGTKAQQTTVVKKAQKAAPPPPAPAPAPAQTRAAAKNAKVKTANTSVALTSAETQVRQTTITSVVTTAPSKLHQVNSADAPVKETPTLGLSPGRTQMITSTGAIATNVIVDSRFHTINSDTGCYTPTPVSVPTIVTPGQAVPGGH